jgi:hypothetical protein
VHTHVNGPDTSPRTDIQDALRIDKRGEMQFSIQSQRLQVMVEV